MASKKKRISIEEFDRLWQDFLNQYHIENSQPAGSQIDLEADITNSSKWIAEFLASHPNTSYQRGDSTIYKNLNGYIQAQKSQENSFEINLNLLNALTAIIHGKNQKFEGHYQSLPTLKPAEQALIRQSFLDTLGLDADAGQEFSSLAALHAPAPPSIGTWLFSKPKHALFLVLLLAAGLLLLLSIGVFAEAWISEQNAAHSVEKFQHGLVAIEGAWILVVCFLIARAPIIRLRMKSAALARASTGLRHLWNYWLLLWFNWLAFYAILFLSYRFGADWNWLSGLIHLLNNATAVCFFLMYLEMSEKTVGPDQKGIQWFPWLFFLFLVAAIEMWTIHMNPAWELAFAIFSGLLNGSALALFISRFTSKTLDVPRLLILALVLYAVIQPSLPMITDSNQTFSQLADGMAGIFYRSVLPITLLIYAYLAKMLLLALVHWLRDTDRLMHYMLRVARLNEFENEIRAATINYLRKEQAENKS